MYVSSYFFMVSFNISTNKHFIIAHCFSLHDPVYMIRQAYIRILSYGSFLLLLGRARFSKEIIEGITVGIRRYLMASLRVCWNHIYHKA